MARWQSVPGAVFDKTWSRAALSQCGHGPVCDLRQTSVSIMLEQCWSEEAAMHRRVASAGPEQPIQCWCSHKGELRQSRG